MIILIKVTKDVLFKSKDCYNNAGINCAIAFAVRQIFPEAYVTEEVLYFWEYQRHNANLPDEAIRFIALFDSLKRYPGIRVDLPEMQFEIDVPSEVIDKIGIGQVYKILSESRTLELVSF